MKRAEESIARSPEEWDRLRDGDRGTLRGRIVAVRKMKLSTFFDLTARGRTIQVYLQGRVAGLQLSSGDLVQVSGALFKTNTGERTLAGEHVVVIAKWRAQIAYSEARRRKSGPLAAFDEESFLRTYFPNRLRGHARRFLYGLHFLEVQTPILGTTYNGGRSFPVTSSYLGNRVGFNRTTMEDRMLSLIGAGHEKIFQIGSIFRSDHERTFLELYGAFIGAQEGRRLVKDLLSYITKSLLADGIGESDITISAISSSSWREVDFLEGARDHLGIDCSAVRDPRRVRSELLARGIIESTNASPESIADSLAQAIASCVGKPVILEGFPVWSSPLYAVGRNVNGEAVLERGRIYLPDGSWGFELGVQERDYESFAERVANQRKGWDLAPRDERVMVSAFEATISGGLPPTFGFAMSIDRILRLWRTNFSIDPYRERLAR